MRIFFIGTWLLWAWSLDAAVQVLNFSQSPSTANFSPHEIELPQFDPMLGVLQSVSFDLRGKGVFIQAFSQFPGRKSNRELEEQQYLTLALTMPGYGEIMSLTQQGGHYGQAGGFRIQPVRVFGHTTLTAESGLTHFTGSGLIDLFFTARPGRTSIGGMNLLTGLWAAGADLVVTYNYTPVPERATWLAGFLALLVVAASRRKVFTPANPTSR